ncbi:MAG: Gfo/Idh/MocA family oxidoreductase [Myxococcota bacterium]|nr:Gfo/Idh/MocA family oxidoreductase [Myxococcota bacterium]
MPNPTYSVLQCTVIGNGRAGKARCRAINKMPNLSLSQHIPYRDLASKNAMENWPADLITICTANRSHFPLSKAALMAKKHVVVEFPPCDNAKQWKELVKLSVQNERVLHCGWIGLLSQAHQARKSFLRSHPVKSVRIHFQGGYYRWLIEEAQRGHHSLLAIARIVSLWDIFGALQYETSQVVHTDDGYDLTLTCTSASGVTIQLHEQRGAFKRRTDWDIQMQNGQRWHPPQTEREPLFEKDFQILRETFAGTLPSFTNSQVTAVYEFLDEIQKDLNPK